MTIEPYQKVIDCLETNLDSFEKYEKGKLYIELKCIFILFLGLLFLLVDGKNKKNKALNKAAAKQLNDANQTKDSKLKIEIGNYREFIFST